MLSSILSFHEMFLLLLPLANLGFCSFQNLFHKILSYNRLFCISWVLVVFMDAFVIYTWEVKSLVWRVKCCKASFTREAMFLFMMNFIRSQEWQYDIRKNMVSLISFCLNHLESCLSQIKLLLQHNFVHYAVKVLKSLSVINLWTFAWHERSKGLQIILASSLTSYPNFSRYGFEFFFYYIFKVGNPGSSNHLSVNGNLHSGLRSGPGTQFKLVDDGERLC